MVVFVKLLVVNEVEVAKDDPLLLAAYHLTDDPPFPDVAFKTTVPAPHLELLVTVAALGSGLTVAVALTLVGLSQPEIVS